jgi:hypothetical protein
MVPRVHVPARLPGIELATVAPLRGWRAKESGAEEETGRSGPFGFAQGRRDDRKGKRLAPLRRAGLKDQRYIEECREKRAERLLAAGYGADD